MGIAQCTTSAPAALNLTKCDNKAFDPAVDKIPLCLAFATPAETIAGTATDLIVNPADLFARENIPAQTGLGLVLSAIPAPAANESNWGTNTLDETLHYMPGVGWKIVTDKYGATVSLPSTVVVPQGVYSSILSVIAPRAGKLEATCSLYLRNLPVAMYNAYAYLAVNGSIISRLGGQGDVPTIVFGAVEISGARNNISVAAGDVLSLLILAQSTSGAVEAVNSLTSLSINYE